MKFIELFAGIGGFRLGLERTGHKCVWANEWLEKPRRIYARQFGEQPDGRDIRTIRSEDIPEADFICGGFPCATFSIAGKRTGFSLEDTRGTLAFEMFRLARDKGIPYIFFENVKGLLNHDNGRTFGIILEVLDGMGYDSQWELLDSQNFGVPQHRERVFLIANLRGKPRPKVFPLGETKATHDGGGCQAQVEGEGIREQGDKGLVIGTLCNRLYGGNTNNMYIEETSVSQWRRSHFREYRSDGVPTLTANMGTGGHNVPFLKQINKIGSGGQGNRVYDAEAGLAPTLRGVGGGIGGKSALIKIPNATSKNDPFIHARSHTQSNMKQRNRQSKYAWTLDSKPQNKMGVSDDGDNIRKFTPLECERLQGFPDDFTKYYDDGSLVADSERYERCGRTVTIPVIEAIGRKFGYEWY